MIVEGICLHFCRACKKLCLADIVGIFLHQKKKKRVVSRHVKSRINKYY